MASLPSIAQPQTQRIPLPFASYKTRAPRGSVTQLVNCAAEQGQAKGDILLNGVPGQTLIDTLPRGVQRGAIKFQGAPHVVAGNRLYKLNKNNTYTELASVPGLGHVPMAQNGAHLVIVVRPTAYVWNGSTLVQITDPDFRESIDCVFNGNYILFIEVDSGRFFGSELGDATDYDALDFATAESFPDDLVGIGSDHGDVFLAGTETCELWGNVGGSGFPFSKRFNGSIEQGCGAGKSIINADQSLFWIDETRIARRLNGVTPVRISQHGVEVAWQKYTTIEDAEGFTYTLDGHIYCVWTFPTANKTWEYDVTAQQWHERESYPYKAWRTKWAMNAYDKVLCGDRDSGKYGYLDPGAYDEFSDPLLMRWTYPTVYAEKNLAFHHELELHCETGVGNANDTDPVVMMEVSDDGGRVWDHLPTVEIGAIGEYRQVITWTGLGSSADRVYRGSISAKVQRSVIQTHLRVTGGNF